MDNQAQELEQLLYKLTLEIGRLAFEIRAPNPITPQLIQTCLEARSKARAVLEPSPCSDTRGHLWKAIDLKSYQCRRCHQTKVNV